MINFLLRTISKKVRIPAGNVKQNLRIPVPEKELIDPSEFTKHSQDFLYKIKIALEDIKASNDDSSLEVQHSTIKFTNKDFTVHIERKFNDQCIQLMIGNGITQNYFYDQNVERWISVSDGHLLEEILCREITEKCQGFFNI